MHYVLEDHYPQRELSGRVYVSYQIVTYLPEPHSSRILAHEINELTIPVAIKVLKTLYEEVHWKEGWQNIICYGPIDYDPEEVLILQPWENIDETDF